MLELELRLKNEHIVRYQTRPVIPKFNALDQLVTPEVR